eukprot:m.77057 g.77057  ORF g.77057 m.77057 type:complete len:453 (-) comp17263_c0_seq2:1138-2496(-)
MGKKKGKGAHGKQDSKPDKKHERVTRAELRRQRKKEKYIQKGDKEFDQFQVQLGKLGLCIVDVAGDGNCLFRSFSHQLFGNCNHHHQLRQNVVNFMRLNADDFAPFVEDDQTFDEYLEELGQNGTYGDNDSIVAFARATRHTVVIHQLKQARWVVPGSDFHPTGVEIHIAYLYGEHYASVRKIEEQSGGPAGVVLEKPLKRDKEADKDGKKKWDGDQTAASNSAPGHNYNHNADAGGAAAAAGSADGDVFSSSSSASAAVAASGVASGHVNQDVSGDAALAQALSRSEGLQLTQHDAAVAAADSSVQRVTAATACSDRDQVMMALCEHGGNVDDTIAYLLQIMSLSDDAAWDRSKDSQSKDKGRDAEKDKDQGGNEGGWIKVQARKDVGKHSSGASEAKLSNRQRKEKAKAERKERRTKEVAGKKAMAAAGSGSSGSGQPPLVDGDMGSRRI